MKKIDFSHEQYMPIEELGRGGMGVVYKCLDTKMSRHVAIKVIGWNPSNDEVVRFHKEAKALAKLQHPNILSVLHFGHSDDDSLFLVMELLTGKSLSSLVESEIIPPFEDALNIFIQICDGLAHAHRKEILHRDIKPSNLFIGRTESGDIIVTITDFGLAKLLTEDQRMTKTGIALGTPAYMSPEQAAGKSVDERADIYSVGCLMFEILVGKQPFQASTIPALLMKHVNEPAPRLSDVAPDFNYPEEMEQILAKCLAKAREERYPQIIDLRDDLQKLKDSLVETYGQIDGNSDLQTGNAARMNEFLLSTVQESPAQKRAQSGAIAIVAIAAVALICFVGGLWSIVGYVRPEDRNLTDASKQANEKMETDYIDNFKIDPKTDKRWIKCRGVGAGRKLLEVANNIRTSLKEDPTDQFYIDGYDSDLTDKQLQVLVELPLLGLRLNGSKRITDVGLQDTVSKLVSLTDLELGSLNITDKGVESLAANQQLEWLNLWNTPITDESLKTIAKIGSLKSICLASCPNLTGSTFGAFKNFRHPITLNIVNSKINPANLKNLQSSQIGYLDAAGINLKDKDMSMLADIPSLNVLRIDHNPDLTSAGFLQLVKLKKLTTVGIKDCPKISADAIKKFKALHPTPPVEVQLTRPDEKD